MKAAAKRCGIQLEPVDMDAEGMLPESLASLCHRHKINGIYTVARMQNPTNACMSYKRIKQICSIIEELEQGLTLLKKVLNYEEGLDIVIL